MSTNVALSKWTKLRLKREENNRDNITEETFCNSAHKFELWVGSYFHEDGLPTFYAWSSNCSWFQIKIQKNSFSNNEFIIQTKKNIV